MHWISITRYVALGLSLFFSVVVLGLTAHTLNTSLIFNRYFDVQPLAIVASVFGLIFLSIFLVVGAIRRGSWMTMIVTELCCLGLLCVFFIATSALATQWLALLYGVSCGDVRLGSIDQTFCHELTAIQGLSFVIWITLLIYTITLLVLSIVGKSRGNHIFRLSVAEAPFFIHSNEVTGTSSEMISQPHLAQAAHTTPSYQLQTPQPHNLAHTPAPTVNTMTPPPTQTGSVYHGQAIL